MRTGKLDVIMGIMEIISSQLYGEVLEEERRFYLLPRE